MNAIARFGPGVLNVWEGTMKTVRQWIKKPYVQVMAGVLYISIVLFFSYRTGHGQRQSPILDMFGLEIAAADLSLGDIWEDDNITRTVTLRNITDQAIEVAGFNSSCGCIGITPRKFVLPAHEKVELQMELGLRVSRGMPMARGNAAPFEVWLTPYVKDRGYPSIPWKLTARVHVPFLIPALDTIDAGIVTEDQIKELSWPIQPHGQLREMKVTTKGNWLDARLSKGYDQLTLVPRADMPLGSFEDELTLSAAVDGLDKRYERQVRVIGKRTGPIVVYPESLLLGMLGQGRSAASTVQFTAAEPFEHEVVQPVDGALTWSWKQDEAMKKELSIQVEVAKEGYGHHELTVACRLKGSGKRYLVPIRISYYGQREGGSP